MSILGRLVILVLIAVLPALAIQAYNEFRLRDDRAREAHDEALRLGHFAAGELDRIVESGRSVLTAVAAHASVRARDPEACARYLGDLAPSFPEYRSIGVVGLDRRLLCTTLGTPPGTDARNWPYFSLALDRGFSIAKYGVGRISNAPVLPLALPFLDEEGHVAGIVYASLNVDWLADYFKAKPFLNGRTTLTIADREGTIVVRLPNNKDYAGRRVDALAQYVFADQPGTADIIGMDGIERILAYIPVNSRPTEGLYVGIGMSKADAFASINRSTNIGFALIGSGLGLALLAAWIGGRSFVSRPVAKLVGAASAWMRGDLDARTNIPAGRSEFAQLGKAFDNMAAALQERQRELQSLLGTLEMRVDERTRSLQTEIAQRERAETDLLHARKLEAVGQLTGGVAHDFNNLLMAIMGSMDLLETRIDPKHRTLVGTARRAAERGAKLTHQLLAFARKQRLQVVPTNLNHVISGTSDMWRQSLGGRIGLDISLAPGLWPAMADEQQIALCLLNLVINARDAMPNGGQLRIATANIHDAAATPEEPLADCVQVIVHDTGVGMDDDVLQRAFEPFFTTKGLGLGSGLGLSMVYGTMRQLGGSVEIKSAPGHGTKVILTFPRAAGGAASVAAASAKPSQRQTARHRILLVDDDTEVREVIAAMLRDAGHSVSEVGGGEEALRLVRQKVAFDLVITDYAMPDMSGVDLAGRLDELRPALPVILLTGFAESADLTLARQSRVVRKPVSSGDLLAAVEAAICEMRGNLVEIRSRSA